MKVFSHMQIKRFDKVNKENYSAGAKKYGSETERIRRHRLWTWGFHMILCLHYLWWFITLFSFFFCFVINLNYFIIYQGWIYIVCYNFCDGWAIFSPILVQLAQNLQEMLLRAVSTTQTRIFSIRMFKVNILRFYSCKINEKNIRKLWKTVRLGII